MRFLILFALMIPFSLSVSAATVGDLVDETADETTETLNAVDPILTCWQGIGIDLHEAISIDPCQIQPVEPCMPSAYRLVGDYPGLDNGKPSVPRLRGCAGYPTNEGCFEVGIWEPQPGGEDWWEFTCGTFWPNSQFSVGPGSYHDFTPDFMIGGLWGHGGGQQFIDYVSSGGPRHQLPHVVMKFEPSDYHCEDSESTGYWCWYFHLYRPVV